MNFENFEEYFTTNLKINDDKKFQEKLDLLLSTDKNKKELIEKNKQKKKEEDLIKQKKLKEQSNEKKIDFILSDENSYDKYEEKLKEKNKEDEYDIDNIFYNKFQEVKDTQKGENSNITNTDNLINKEKNRNDTEFMKMTEDIKKNNPKIYNPKKIKKYKEMIDLKIGLKNKDKNEEKQIKNKKQMQTHNLRNKDNNDNIQKEKNNINKTSSENKNFKNTLKKNIIKNEIKKENNDEDLIMSLIQCPIQSCHKTKIELQKDIKLNQKINRENEKQIKKDNIKENKDENKSLLNIYKKEKEMKNKLQDIILNNQLIKQKDFFSEENEYNNQFYNFDSNSKYLTKARDILLENLSEGDKKLIRELDEQLINVKNQISDINEEKNKYNKMIEEKKKELEKFESEKNKEEFEYERELINELRSVVNNFKMEIYKKELGINNRENNEDKSKNENENDEIKILNNKYNELKNDLNTINKNNEKFIVDIQKKIMILKYENEQMKEKIESYQQSENLEKIDSEKNINDNLLLLNQNMKKSKLIQFDDDQKISINKDFGLNNIIKTSSKLYHLKELDFEFPEKYFNDNDNKVVKHKFELDGKTIKIYKNNKKEIIFPNNTRKETFPDGYTVVYFSNGDIKELIPNNKEIYYYKKDEVYQIEFADGTKYIKYLKTGKIFCDGNPIN